jgi:hypothetical protein
MASAEQKSERTSVASKVGVTTMGLIVDLPALPPIEQVIDYDPVASEARIRQHLENVKAWIEQAVNTLDPQPVADYFDWAKSLTDMAQAVRLSTEAQLDTREMLRRLERALGIVIRNGQAAGIFSSVGGKFKDESRQGVSPVKFYRRAGGTKTFIYKFSDDVTDQIFEQALALCRAEEKITRDNTLHHITQLRMTDHTEQSRSWRVQRIAFLASRNYTSYQIAEDIGYSRVTNVRRMAELHGIDIPADRKTNLKARGIDPERVISTAVTTLEGADSGLQLIDFADIHSVDPDHAAQWYESLKRTLPTLIRLRRELSRVVRTSDDK